MVRVQSLRIVLSECTSGTTDNAWEAGAGFDKEHLLHLQPHPAQGTQYNDTRPVTGGT